MLLNLYCWPYARTANAAPCTRTTMQLVLPLKRKEEEAGADGSCCAAARNRLPQTMHVVILVHGKQSRPPVPRPPSDNQWQYIEVAMGKRRRPLGRIW